MKVFGNPNETVNTWVGIGARKRIAVLFQFDDKGVYEFDESKVSKETLAKIKDNFKIEEPKKFKCKHCDYETENKGELLAHYREHKKED